MSRVFSRHEFYDLVWSKPMTHLAKEFALSDVGLHKVCRKHDIPTPPLGWWAKKAAGKPVKQTQLPCAKDGTSDKITIAAGELRAEPGLIAAARENARLLASTIDMDAVLPANPIVDRTVAQLREAKPSSINGLVTVEGLNVIKVSVAPADQSGARSEHSSDIVQVELRPPKLGFRTFAPSRSRSSSSDQNCIMVNRSSQCSPRV
jgi:hypothetical protein